MRIVNPLLPRHAAFRLLLTLAGLAVAAAGGFAQEKQGAVHELGIDFRPAWVVPTHHFFEGDNRTGKPVRQATGVHLKYAFRFAPDSRWGRLYPHAYQGIGLAYNCFDNPEAVGRPAALYVFQGSRIARLSPTLSLDYEWNFGASFGWRKGRVEEEVDAGRRVEAYYDTEVTGSNANAYINASLLLDWRLAPRWRLTAGIDLTHYSNGNTHYPNAGINLVGGRVSLVRSFGGKPGDSRPAEEADPVPQRRMCYDVVLYGATRKQGFTGSDGISRLLPGVYGVAGFNFTPLYAFNRYFRAGLSLDAQFDESANLQEYYAGDGSGLPQFYRPPFWKRVALGLSARAELAMPIFSVGVGLGRNVAGYGQEGRKFYQVLVLKTFLSRCFFLHVGYQLEQFQYPNNLMLGMGVRL